MKTAFFIIGLLSLTGLSAQLNQKVVEKKEGAYTYCHYQNGKISTEEFHTNSTAYMAEGYAKAFDKNGIEIYNQPVSRNGLLSAVSFSYYENGGIREANYNTHPDGGIQGYKKTTWFDEDGKITNEISEDHESWNIFQIPDTSYSRVHEERLRSEQLNDLERIKEQYLKDSTAFYCSTVMQADDGTVITFIPDPEHGLRREIVTRNGKMIKSTLEYFVKTEGIQAITRTYFKNGRIHEEYTYEATIWHYREYDQKGNLVQEILNEPVVNYE